MRRNMIIVSVTVHLAVLAAMVLAAEKKILRRPTAIAVTDEKKKDKPKPPPPKPAEPPKPKPKPAAPKPAADEAKPVPSNAPPPPSGPAPIDTGLQLGNSDGPGIDVGGPRGGPAATPDKQADNRGSTPKKGPAPKKGTPDKQEEECQEEASKPEPLSTSDLKDIYTASKARVDGVEGKMSLRVTVDKDGSVSRVDVLQSVDPQLDAAIAAAIEKWRFKPATRCGKAVAGGTFVVKARFELGD